VTRTPYQNRPAQPADHRLAALRQLLHNGTLAVTHAGHGTTLDCLLAGVPMMMLPMHMEQLMVTQRVAATGAGLGVLPSHVESEFAQVLGELTRNPRYKESATAVAARYRDISPSRALEEIVRVIEQALNSAQVPRP
jgi:UDP:flavonoid glycosyltransferase YjiC (YdhE family)